MNFSDWNWSSIISGLPSLLMGLAGAGPWGIAAMVLGIVAMLGGAGFLIAKFNGKIDASDLERGGADVGETAVDLRNQADSNRQWMDKEREAIKKEFENET